MNVSSMKKIHLQNAEIKDALRLSSFSLHYSSGINKWKQYQWEVQHFRLWTVFLRAMWSIFPSRKGIKSRASSLISIAIWLRLCRLTFVYVGCRNSICCTLLLLSGLKGHVNNKAAFTVPTQTTSTILVYAYTVLIPVHVQLQYLQSFHHFSSSETQYWRRRRHLKKIISSNLKLISLCMFIEGKLIFIFFG